MVPDAVLGLCQVWKVPRRGTSPPALKAQGASNLLENHYKGKVRPSNPKRSPQEMNLGLDALFTYGFTFSFFFMDRGAEQSKRNLWGLDCFGLTKAPSLE